MKKIKSEIQHHSKLTEAEIRDKIKKRFSLTQEYDKLKRERDKLLVGRVGEPPWLWTIQERERMDELDTKIKELSEQISATLDLREYILNKDEFIKVYLPEVERYLQGNRVTNQIEIYEKLRIESILVSDIIEVLASMGRVSRCLACGSVIYIYGMTGMDLQD